MILLIAETLIIRLQFLISSVMQIKPILELESRKDHEERIAIDKLTCNDEKLDEGYSKKFVNVLKQKLAEIINLHG